MQRSAIISKVRAKIDEITAHDDIQLVDDVFAVIDENLEDSANDFLQKAPLWLLQGKEFPANRHFKRPDGSGTIPLPSDFLRLKSFQMSEWRYPVYEVITDKHPRYRHLSNPHLTGTPNNPIVAIVGGGESNNLLLEYYTVRGSHEIKRSHYIQRVVKGGKGDDFTVMSLSPKEIDGFVWQMVADFFLIVQQPGLAQAAAMKLTEFFALNSWDEPSPMYPPPPGKE